MQKYLISRIRKPAGLHKVSGNKRKEARDPQLPNLKFTFRLERKNFRVSGPTPIRAGHRDRDWHGLDFLNSS
eukprot:2471399-Rhodomonas_salina.1